MDAAAAEDVVSPAEFFDIDMVNLDGFDFDLAADEFYDAYAAFVADADSKSSAGTAAPGGWLGGLGIDGFTGSSSAGSSPDSGVTDGPLAAEGGSLSAYIYELERFLLENDDVVDDEAACPDGEEGAEEELSVDDYYGDLLAAVEDAAGKNADEESLDAREDDQPTSRKRARRHKIRGTAMMLCSWGELEVTRRHLARMQVPTLWRPAVPALRCV